ncbi:MAG: hypothetical protein KF849_00560 [Rhizobiaceae bacterium]|nr:hypothetical protein [Rhizobiaceae bacterium]
MTDIVLSLGNARPDTGARRYEHLFPEKNPRWRFAQLFDAASKPEGPAGEGGMLVTATARGPRVVGVDYAGPLALWIVLTNPAEGKEEEYNVWYDGRHVADTLALPGLTAAQRYTVKNIAGPEGARWSYLAIYEVELDRVGEALAEAAARAGTPKMPNPGMLAPGTAALPFRPIG